MQYQTFGRLTGLRVSQYALGTANFSTSDAGAGALGSRRIFEGFVAAGGTTFDSSNVYQDGQAETALGELLGRERDEFVIVTKYSGTRRQLSRHGTTGNSRKTMVRALEASLRRLRTDYVDVFMPHFPDGVTPMAEILAGLDDLVAAGKILHGGLSNFPAWRVAGAAVRAELAGRAPLVGIETEYSLAERSAERELLPMAQAHGLGVLTYSPLAGGLLTGKYRHGHQGRLSAGSGSADVEGSEQRRAVVDAVLAVADEVGATATGVSLAWLRRRAERASTALVTILGPRSPEQLADHLDVVELDDAHVRRLDDAGAVRPGTPHEDVAAALSSGFDGDRSRLREPLVPVA